MIDWFIYEFGLIVQGGFPTWTTLLTGWGLLVFISIVLTNLYEDKNTSEPGLVIAMAVMFGWMWHWVIMCGLFTLFGLGTAYGLTVGVCNIARILTGHKPKWTLD